MTFAMVSHLLDLLCHGNLSNEHLVALFPLFSQAVPSSSIWSFAICKYKGGRIPISQTVPGRWTMNWINAAFLTLWTPALLLIVQEKALKFFVRHFPPCVYPLSHMTKSPRSSPSVLPYSSDQILEARNSLRMRLKHLACYTVELCRIGWIYCCLPVICPPFFTLLSVKAGRGLLLEFLISPSYALALSPGSPPARWRWKIRRGEPSTLLHMMRGKSTSRL